nr:MAG TPA: hypothetical protein [Crassvirales sp.]
MDWSLLEGLNHLGILILEGLKVKVLLKERERLLMVKMSI